MYRVRKDYRLNIWYVQKRVFNNQSRHEWHIVDQYENANAAYDERDRLNEQFEQNSSGINRS